jgi:hypothetical protein
MAAQVDGKFVIPKGVQKTAQRGLRLSERTGKRPAEAQRLAQDLVSAEAVEAEMVAKLAERLKRAAPPDSADQAEPETIVEYLLLGGDPARRWAGEVMRKLQKA